MNLLRQHKQMNLILKFKEMMKWNDLTIVITGKKVATIDIVYDEQYYLIKQLKLNKLNLIYGNSEFPVAIEGDENNILSKTGLRERVMKIPIKKYIEVRKMLEAPE